MKKIMKNIAVGLMVGLLAVSQVRAVEAVFSVPIVSAASAYATNLISGAVRVYEIEIQAGAPLTNWTWGIFNSPNTNTTRGPAQGYSLTTYSNGAFTTYSSYLTNITVTVTNFAGAGTNSAAGVLGGTWTTNQTRTGIYTYSISNPATTNQYRQVYGGNAPTAVGNILTIPISDSGVFFSQGFTWTNGPHATNITVTVRYEPAR